MHVQTYFSFTSVMNWTNTLDMQLVPGTNKKNFNHISCLTRRQDQTPPGLAWVYKGWAGQKVLIAEKHMHIHRRIQGASGSTCSPFHRPLASLEIVTVAA